MLKASHPDIIETLKYVNHHSITQKENRVRSAVSAQDFMDWSAK